MSDVAISAESLGKKFVIGRQRASDFRNAFGAKLKELFRLNQRISEDFWALKDISFQIKAGEAVGIIGRNGAGKSTLLKILSRITEPSTGRFEINGRVSSLLEVGTGFHMELTGRENVYLNGTILGMKRAEIKAKFDEIVAFSGVEKFIDTPVKHYSSGMKVRLAFSVAAHLEPEILIVDEVLAVGDAEFQKKCLGKMDEVSKDHGRTVLFVSHNMGAVQNLCSKGIVLIDGKLTNFAMVDVAIDAYKNIIAQLGQNNDLDLTSRRGTGIFRVNNVQILNKDGINLGYVTTGSPVVFRLDFGRVISRSEGNFRLDIAINDEMGARLCWFSTYVVDHQPTKDFNEIDFEIPIFPLAKGHYFLTYYATLNGEVIDWVENALRFSVENGHFFETGRLIPTDQSKMYVNHSFIFN